MLENLGKSEKSFHKIRRINSEISKNGMRYLERTLETVLAKISSVYKGIMVSGMRQVGKGTLLKHLDGTRRYLTLNDSRLLRMAKQSPEQFLLMNPPPISVDEIQWAPELFPALKAPILTKPTKKVWFGFPVLNA